MTHDDERPAILARAAPLEPWGDVLGGRVADELLVAAGRGDLGALAAFYDRTAPAVLGLLRAVLGAAPQAERAAERVYLRVWRTAPRFDPAGGSAYALLLGAARRELVGRVRDIVADRR